MSAKNNMNYLDTLRLDHCKFDGDEWKFFSDSQDTQAVKENIGQIAMEFDSFFVKIGDGEYLEAWGINGIIPYTNKTAYQIL